MGIKLEPFANCLPDLKVSPDSQGPFPDVIVARQMVVDERPQVI
jgi:hypothetical protein